MSYNNVKQVFAEIPATLKNRLDRFVFEKSLDESPRKTTLRSTLIEAIEEYLDNHEEGET